MAIPPGRIELGAYGGGGAEGEVPFHSTIHSVGKVSFPAFTCPRFHSFAIGIKENKTRGTEASGWTVEPLISPLYSPVSLGVVIKDKCQHSPIPMLSIVVVLKLRSTLAAEVFPPMPNVTVSMDHIETYMKFTAKFTLTLRKIIINLTANLVLKPSTTPSLTIFLRLVQPNIFPIGFPICHQVHL